MLAVPLISLRFWTYYDASESLGWLSCLHFQLSGICTLFHKTLRSVLFIVRWYSNVIGASLVSPFHRLVRTCGFFGAGLFVGVVCLVFFFCFLCCWPIFVIELSNHDYLHSFMTATVVMTSAACSKKKSDLSMPRSCIICPTLNCYGSHWAVLVLSLLDNGIKKEGR